MLIPFESDRADEMSDEEILAAYAEAGLSEAYGMFAIEVLRGRHDSESMPVL